MHDCFEIYCLLEGKVTFKVEEEVYSLENEGILLIPPGAKHSAEIHSAKYERIVLWLNSWYLQRISSRKTNLSSCFITNEESQHMLRTDPLSKNKIITSLKEIREEVSHGRFGKDILMDAHLVRLLVSINRSLDHLLIEEKVKFYDVINFINQHYTENITLDFLAEKFFISKFYLSRSFEQSTGRSIHQYILSKRMFMAKQLLVSGEKPTDIHALCGYPNYSNFYRAFKRYYKMTPGQFLKEPGRETES